jgi:methyl-accepting chemotaxis protein
MWRFLRNMPIARRLMAAAVITALIPGLVISILGGSYINTLSTINDTVQAGNSAVKIVTHMQADLLRMDALLEVLNTSSSSTADNIQNSHEIVQLTNDFNSSLTTYKQDYQITTSPKMKSIRESLQNDSQGNQVHVSQHDMIYVVDLQWHIYNNAQHQVLLDIDQNTSADTLAGDVSQANLEYLPLKGNLDNLVGLTENMSQIVAEINTFKINPIIIWTVIAFVFSILVVFAVSYLINLTITRPLRQLVSLTERIARGETNARAIVTGHDETALVSASMNAMLDSIVRLMKNIQLQHDFLETRVQGLIAEVKSVGSGDLRPRAEVTSDALGFLAHSFNYMLDELSNLVIRAKIVTSEAETQARAMELSIKQLTISSDYQVQNMEEIVEAVEKMTAENFMVAHDSQILTNITHETQQRVQIACEEAHRSAVNKEMISLFDETIYQMEGMECINDYIQQQVQKSQSILDTLENMKEINLQGNEKTYETIHTMEKLAHLVTILHVSIDAFKLREEESPFAS